MGDLDKIKKFKDDIDNIEVPAEIDFAIEKGLKKKEKKDKIKRLSIYFATAATFIVIILNTPFVKTRIGNFYFQKTLKTDSRGMATLNSYSNLKIILQNCQTGITRGNPKTTIDYSVKNGAINKSADMASTGSAKGSSVQNSSHSSTNVQVDGVDEPDLIKNDGKFIYSLNKKNNTLNIISAYPAKSMKVQANISIETGLKADNMFLTDKYLIVLGNKEGKAKVLIYDISNKKSPKIAKSLILSGAYRDSRLVGDKIYIIANEALNPDFTEADKKSYTPSYIDSSSNGESRTVDFKNIRYNPEDVHPNYIIIAGINLSNINNEAKVTAVLGSGTNIYCNGKNIYTAAQSSETKTTIYKFVLSNGKAEMGNKAEVSGNLLNQFSMDEYNGYLRMAVSENVNHVDADDMSSTVYIFDEKLKLVSKLSGIAKGEKIYSTRFVGNRAYIVTFKQMDPLFALDLSDPKKPKITGKLEMPGFSTYLQPYDENHIIGFGESTHSVIENGYSMAEPDGIKFAMFDITDMANPKKMYDVNFGNTISASEYNSTQVAPNNNMVQQPSDNSNNNAVRVPGDNSDKTSNYDVAPAPNITRYSSEVLSNHKALLFDRDKGIMALPVESIDRQGLKCGIYVYKVDLKNGFKLAYKLESQKNESLTCRSVYMGDTLYTIFDSKIVAVDMNNFKEVGELKF